MQPFEKSLRFGIGRELAFGRAKLGRVDAAARAALHHRNLDMQHLVVHHKVHHQARHARMIQQTAEHNGVMVGVVMSQQSSRALGAPTQLRAGHEAGEMPLIHGLEDLGKIEAYAGRRGDLLPAPCLAHGA